MNRLPTLFLSHGSPMHAVDPGTAGRAWAALGHSLPRPRGVLVASAHWETSVPMLTGNPKPQVIHDFGGFPEALYRERYPAPGAPDLAAAAIALLKSADITAGIDGCRGFDHGVWVPLKWMYPEHDVPIVELSLQPELGTAHHLRVGRALAPLANNGVLVIGSGHTTHNLRDWMANLRRYEPLHYAEAFAAWLKDRLAAHDAEAIVAYRERAPDAVRAHPTEEHFLPLLVAWGAAGTDARAERIVDGFEAGALALDSYLFHPARDSALRIEPETGPATWHPAASSPRSGTNNACCCVAEAVAKLGSHAFIAEVDHVLDAAATECQHRTAHRGRFTAAERLLARPVSLRVGPGSAPAHAESPIGLLAAIEHPTPGATLESLHLEYRV